MRTTTSPATKQTLRDLKPGARFMLMAGLGSSAVLRAYQVTDKHDGFVFYREVWDAQKGFGMGPGQSCSKADASEAIKTGWWRTDYENFDSVTGHIKSRPMTKEESDQADVAAQKWEQFTKSETYQCM